MPLTADGSPTIINGTLLYQTAIAIAFVADQR